jgi:hypothetical protein
MFPVATTRESRMEKRRVVQVAILVWAAVGAAIALPALGSVNVDARVLVGVAAVLGPLAAVSALCMITRGADRPAGALLLVSVLTPTYFAYVFNVPALVLGLLLLAAPGVVFPRRRTSANRTSLAPSRSRL